MHFVLGCFKRDACYHAGSLDALCRAGFAVSGYEAMSQDVVERMLDTGEAFGRVVVFIVDMEVTVAHGIAGLGGEQVIVNERLGGF